MKSQSPMLKNEQFIETYKNVIDSFGGPNGMAEKFDWSISTIYRWLAGKVIGLTHAICIVSNSQKFSLADLVGYELDCDPTYLKMIAHYGGQSATADALGLAQPTVRAWLVGGTNISLEKAELLERITNGKFHPSDFSHLCDQAG